MLGTSISVLINTYKRKSSLGKWIAQTKEQVRVDAYANRKTIYKDQLEHEIARLDGIVTLWELFKKLRKKSSVYDVYIKCDRQGYITMKVTFPITEQELTIAKQNIINFKRSNKALYWGCIREPEEVYKVCHERINKVFKDLMFLDYGAYYPFHSPMTRYIDFARVKN